MHNFLIIPQVSMPVLRLLSGPRGCQILRLPIEKCGNTAPKTVKTWNFPTHLLLLKGDSFAQFLRISQRLYT